MKTRTWLGWLLCLTVFLSMLPRLQAVDFVDNLVVLLDSSGSMDGRKINDAKKAVKAVIGELPETINIGLLVFPQDDRNWTYPLSPLRHNVFNQAVDKITADNNTPLGSYMKVAADALLAARAKQFGYGTYRLLIVTDGDANSEAHDLVKNNTYDILSRGIRIDVIGVEMSSGHILANKVHTYRTVAKSQDLNKAMKEVLAEFKGSQEDNLGGQNPYEIIAPLPPEIASAAITALAHSGNHPIGEKPSPSSDETSQATTVSTPDPQAGTTVPPGTAEPNWPMIFLIVLLIMIVVIGLGAILSR